jgi:hypothetical protein
MNRAKIEHQSLLEFRKLSPKGRGEVLSYTEWMRDLESKERLTEFKNSGFRR